jgi:hypothetical protein
MSEYNKSYYASFPTTSIIGIVRGMGWDQAAGWRKYVWENLMTDWSGKLISIEECESIFGVRRPTLAEAKNILANRPDIARHLSMEECEEIFS